ncbi:HAD hydrolase-like protein [Anaerotignum sp.]
MDTLKQNIILFDLDGTLTDSMEGVIRSVQYMQEKMGMRVWEFEELRFIVGPPLIESFTKELAMELPKAEKAVEVFRERYTTVGLFENKVFPGIMELLEELKKKGKRMAVATSKKEDQAVRILEHFGIAPYLEVIGGDAREIGRDTKAKVIEYVLETMGAAKDDVIMVGDRKFDIIGAHALGLPCIAVEWGYGDRAEFEAHDADIIASTTEDVAKLF